MKLSGLFILFFISVVFTLQFVSAVQTSPDGSLQIAYPPYENLPINTDFYFYVQVYNATSYIQGEIATCYIDVYNKQGIQVCNNAQLTAGADDYSITLTAGNFSTVGEHAYLVQCNTTNEAGFISDKFNVTTTGDGYSNTVPLFLLFGGIIILVLAFLLKNDYIGFMSGILFIIAGMYIIIYGLGNIYGFYTDTLGYVSLGIGLLVFLASAYSAINHVGDNLIGYNHEKDDDEF